MEQIKKEELQSLQDEASAFIEKREKLIIDVFKRLNVNGISLTINYQRMNAQLLSDIGIIWIKWYRYDCPLKSLNPLAMSTITSRLIDYANE